MKENLDNALKFEDYIRKEYPNYFYSADLITPCLTNKEHSFSKNDFDYIFEKYPKLFTFNEKENDSKYRCSGGISQCTIMTNGYLKICNGAVDEIFKFKNNVFETGLIRAWTDCGKIIAKYRREKRRSSKICKKCNLRHKCSASDCRIISKAYLNSENLPNPIICYSMRKKYKV